MALALRFAIGNSVQQDVAAGAAHLILCDDPVESQFDTKFARQRLPKLDLKSRRVAGFAGKGQRVGGGTPTEHALRADGVERSRLDRSDQSDDDAGNKRNDCFHLTVSAGYPTQAISP